MKLFTVFDDVLDRASRYGLIGCLFTILGLTIFSILLRWLGSNLIWVDPLVRHLVFLSIFLGGSIATSKKLHIKVNLIMKLIGPTRSKMINWVHKNLITLFCLIVCLLLVRSGWNFYLVEKEFGAPGFLHIHSSILVGIIPLGMGLITLRFFNQLMIGIVHGDET